MYSSEPFNINLSFENITLSTILKIQTLHVYMNYNLLTLDTKIGTLTPSMTFL